MSNNKPNQLTRNVDGDIIAVTEYYDGWNFIDGVGNESIILEPNDHTIERWKEILVLLSLPISTQRIEIDDIGAVYMVDESVKEIECKDGIINTKTGVVSSNKISTWALIVLLCWVWVGIANIASSIFKFIIGDMISIILGICYLSVGICAIIFVIAGIITFKKGNYYIAKRKKM